MLRSTIGSAQAPVPGAMRFGAVRGVLCSGWALEHAQAHDTLLMLEQMLQILAGGADRQFVAIPPQFLKEDGVCDSHEFVVRYNLQRYLRFMPVVAYGLDLPEATDGAEHADSVRPWCERASGYVSMLLAGGEPEQALQAHAARVLAPMPARRRAAMRHAHDRRGAHHRGSTRIQRGESRDRPRRSLVSGGADLSPDDRVAASAVQLAVLCRADRAPSQAAPGRIRAAAALIEWARDNRLRGAACQSRKGPPRAPGARCLIAASLTAQGHSGQLPVHPKLVRFPGLVKRRGSRVCAGVARAIVHRRRVRARACERRFAQNRKGAATLATWGNAPARCAATLLERSVRGMAVVLARS